MRQFIKCDTCDSPIYFGDTCYKMSGRAGCYCSAECFACAYSDECDVNMEEAENSYKKVYDEDIADSTPSSVCTDNNNITVTIDGVPYQISKEKRGQRLFCQ